MENKVIETFYVGGDYELESVFTDDLGNAESVNDLADVEIRIVDVYNNVLQSFKKSDNTLKVDPEQSNRVTYTFDRAHNKTLGLLKLRVFKRIAKEGMLEGVQVVPTGTETFAKVIR
jgi:predicted acetyltransferase